MEHRGWLLPLLSVGPALVLPACQQSSPPVDTRPFRLVSIEALCRSDFRPEGRQFSEAEIAFEKTVELQMRGAVCPTTPALTAASAPTTAEIANPAPPSAPTPVPAIDASPSPVAAEPNPQTYEALLEETRQRRERRQREQGTGED
ncbi:hypothetical protein [Belnapia rosea]|uniref:hypothetical protein n=1 Tax=Belnapia rosea TaxID=938405 RepID=UPI0011600519|nr:hypothetical protein [Belnapia rosea]